MDLSQLTTLRVNVTENHIQAGTPRDDCNCAVALAVRDAIPKEFYRPEMVVEVFDDYIMIGDEFGEPFHLWFAVPQSVHSFIDAYDSSDPKEQRKAKPFSFTVTHLEDGRASH